MVSEVDLCKRLMDVTYYVAVFLDGQKVGEGSGVCYRPDGWLLTAAHVIDNKLSRDGARLDPKFVNDPELTVIAKSQTGPYQRYSLVQVGLEIDLPPYLKYPMIVDLAILRPTTRVMGAPYLPPRQSAASEGTSVLLSGFPDEISLPFNFDNKVDRLYPEISERQEDLEILGIQVFMKHGMVGRSFPVDIADPKATIRLIGNHYWIDQSSHYGASGGPVGDMEGNLVGIICQRATTDVSSERYPQLRVPSGSTLALSPSLIAPWL